jgi:TolB-like protein/Flp pilus assembly protein TadD
MAYQLPDKPSIAVLPFVNMSEDPNQEYLADGITENIISALSQVPKLFVIARNSTYTYKGKPVKVQKVAEELGVRYVLEGSVQRSGDSLRITAQFIDALTGHHLWSERYDRELENIFALQDEIAIEIITALQVKLTTGEEARLTAKGTDDLQAYLNYLQARESFFTQTREGNAQARRLVEEAIEQDPEFPGAYLLLGATHWMDVIYGSSKSPEESLKRAFELTKKAIALDDSDATAHSLLGWLYVFMKREYDKAIAECEQAVALAPSSAMANIWMSGVLTFAGRHEEAVRYAKQALRLNPFPEGWYFRFLGYTYFGAGRNEEAIAAYKKALDRAPNDIMAHLALTTAYSWAGRLQEARAQAAEVLRINPKFSIKQRAKTLPYKNQTDHGRYLDGLRKAGLPETPPLPLPDKPSIAVLPFVNMSGDPEQEYFSDGLTEEIITALSKTPKLFVIARNSSFTYKGKSVWIPTVGKELGVKYVLEGSVRKAADKVRVTAQLIDAQTNNHIWAERYDRDLKDVFLVQDEITKKITTAMQVTLTEGEQAQLFGRGTKNLKAYLKLLEARERLLQFNNDANQLARQNAEEAISLDPEYANARALLAFTHILDVWFKWSKSPRESLAHAFDLARKAIALDKSCVLAHRILSHIYLFKRQHEKAIAEGELAVSLAPNDANSVNHLGLVLRYGGRAEEAIPMHERAIRLDPMPPPAYLYQLGLCYALTGDPGKAISICKKALHQNLDDLAVHLALAIAYSLSGNEGEARVEAAEVLRIHPKFSVEYAARTWPYKNEADIETITGALRKAGLK